MSNIAQSTVLCTGIRQDLDLQYFQWPESALMFSWDAKELIAAERIDSGIKYSEGLGKLAGNSSHYNGLLEPDSLIEGFTIDRDILHEARKHQEKQIYLLVMVAGYSAYFITLGKPVQDEIIKRTEYATLG